MRNQAKSFNITLLATRNFKQFYQKLYLIINQSSLFEYKCNCNVRLRVVCMSSNITQIWTYQRLFRMTKARRERYWMSPLAQYSFFLYCDIFIFMYIHIFNINIRNLYLLNTINNCLKLQMMISHLPLFSGKLYEYVEFLKYNPIPVDIAVLNHHTKNLL